jgi:hypothetical protein
MIMTTMAPPPELFRSLPEDEDEESDEEDDDDQEPRP